MKKQLIIIASVFAAALLLFLAYEIFFKPSDIIDEPVDSFYVLSDSAANALADESVSGEIIFCAKSESEISSDESLSRILTFAKSICDGASNRVKVSFDSANSFDGITVKTNGNTKNIEYTAFYKTLTDGTKYAFDGESLITNALLELCGKEAVALSLRALSGYDTDGDIVLASTGKPFVYQSISRSDVQSLTVRNAYGSYRVYRAAASSEGDTTTFFFLGAEFVGYDKEMFSKLIVNSTYVLASGKVQDHLDYSVYGLDDEEKATCVFTVVTTSGVIHKVIIGNKTTNGSYYYARYDGKDMVYLLPAADLEESLLLPESNYLTALLVYPISETEDLYKIDNVIIDFLDTGVKLSAKTFSLCAVSENVKPYEITADGKTTATDVGAVLTDKKKFGGSYTLWSSDATLAGFRSSDGKEVYTDLCLLNYAENGKYHVSFGLLRDESADAYLPTGIRAAYSTDGGSTYTDIGSVGELTNLNKELKYYSLDFVSETPVTNVRLYLTLQSGKYAVMDEFSVLVDGEDSQPADALAGNWKLTEPQAYIPVGRNLIYPDSNNFGSIFLSSVASLVGDKVVETGICSDIKDLTTLNKTKLAKYGLDNPDFSVQYDFSGWTSKVYFKRPVESGGNYYAYSVETYTDSEGETISICTDIIAEVSLETAEWLDWDVVDYLDHNLLSMYIDDIDFFNLSFGGTDYRFELIKGSDGKLTDVYVTETANGVTTERRKVDTQNFRYLYVSVIGISLKGEYEAGDETPSEVLKIKVESASKSPEIIFYRVTTAKAYYTVDGQGKYYILIDKVNKVKNNVALLLSGQDVPR